MNKLDQYKNLPIPNTAGYKNEPNARERFDVNDNPLLFYKLEDYQQARVLEWCGRINKIKSFNSCSSSYGLKHVFEKSPGGFYMSNGAFKGAMILAGFDVKDTSDLNWQFNISQKSYNQLWNEAYRQ